MGWYCTSSSLTHVMSMIYVSFSECQPWSLITGTSRLLIASTNRITQLQTVIGCYHSNMMETRIRKVLIITRVPQFWTKYFIITTWRNLIFEFSAITEYIWIQVLDDNLTENCGHENLLTSSRDQINERHTVEYLHYCLPTQSSRYRSIASPICDKSSNKVRF